MSLKTFWNKQVESSELVQKVSQFLSSRTSRERYALLVMFVAIVAAGGFQLGSFLLKKYQSDKVNQEPMAFNSDLNFDDVKRDLNIWNGLHSQGLVYLDDISLPQKIQSLAGKNGIHAIINSVDSKDGQKVVVEWSGEITGIVLTLDELQSMGVTIDSANISGKLWKSELSLIY